MIRYEIVRCLEESPKVMGLNLKTAVFCSLILLFSLFMLVKSIFSLGLNVLIILLLKLDKRFSKKGAFEMYLDKISHTKKTFVYDTTISSLIKE